MKKEIPYIVQPVICAICGEEIPRFCSSHCDCCGRLVCNSCIEYSDPANMIYQCKECFNMNLKSIERLNIINAQYRKDISEIEDAMKKISKEQRIKYGTC